MQAVVPCTAAQEGCTGCPTKTGAWLVLNLPVGLLVWGNPTPGDTLKQTSPSGSVPPQPALRGLFLPLAPLFARPTAPALSSGSSSRYYVVLGTRKETAIFLEPRRGGRIQLISSCAAALGACPSSLPHPWQSPAASSLPFGIPWQRSGKGSIPITAGRQQGFEPLAIGMSQAARRVRVVGQALGVCAGVILVWLHGQKCGEAWEGGLVPPC